MCSFSSFYRECFGLEIAETAEDYCVLESDAWTLSLVVVGMLLPRRSRPRSRRSGEGTPVRLSGSSGSETLRLSRSRRQRGADDRAAGSPRKACGAAVNLRRRQCPPSMPGVVGLESATRQALRSRVPNLPG